MKLLKFAVLPIVSGLLLTSPAFSADTKKPETKKTETKSQPPKSQDNNQALKQLKQIEAVKPKNKADAQKGFDKKIEDKSVKAGQVTKQDPVKIAKDESAKQRERDKLTAAKYKTKPVPAPGQK